MPLSRIKSNQPAIDDTNTQTRSDGRFNVTFHSSPQTLSEFIERFQSTVVKHGAKEQPQAPRKNSKVFLDEKATTGPRLNIAIHIVGSRGDVQPFIPIAQLLAAEPFHHRVRICTHPVFKDFVESNGVEFFSIGGDPEALMAYMVKNPGLLPSMESVKAGDVTKRRKEMDEIIHGSWRSCIEAGDGMGGRTTAAQTLNVEDLFVADAIIANPPSTAHIHCAEKLGIPVHMVFTMPWSPTRSFHHPLAAMKYDGDDLSAKNYMSYLAMELLTWQGLGDLINKFRTRTLRLDAISPMWGSILLPRLRVPYTYLWSETLIPKPQDWGSHISIAGFSFLPLAKSYTPPADLTRFLDAGPPPVYIGFGSIVVDDPQGLTKLIFEAVALANVRAIVSKGWGGVGGGDVPENIYLIGNCPHDWLFQRVSAVVHHGGAGTTAAGIAAGRPTVVVPFFGDQPFWGQMIARAGAGPQPVPFKEMTAASLAASITSALQPDVQVAVQRMATSMAQEAGALTAASNIHAQLDTDRLRCDLCPSRVAHWKHTRSGAHLSSFAATCLVQAAVLDLREFKLLRHKSWLLAEGAEGPFIGALASVSGFFMSLGIATSHFHHRLKTASSQGSAAASSKDALSRAEQAQAQAQAVDGAPMPPPEIRKMHAFALKMASKSLVSTEDPINPIPRAPTFHEKRKADWMAREAGSHGRAYYVTRACGRYAADVAKAGLQVPVAFFYNVANGFRNSPANFWEAAEVRARGEIVGVGSGMREAGRGFVVDLWDGVSGVVVRPYRGAQEGGAKGLIKGIGFAGHGLFSGIGAAVFGVPGFTLKGVEREFAKRKLTKLAAEIMLVRIRQGISDFEGSTLEEREEVVGRWRQVRG